MLGAEDEQDACAATKAKAEEAAELAEFDEGIPYNDEASKVGLNPGLQINRITLLCLFLILMPYANVSLT